MRPWIYLLSGCAASASSVDFEVPKDAFETRSQFECLAIGVPVIDAEQRDRAGEAENAALANIALVADSVAIPQGWRPVGGGGLESTGHGLVSSLIICREGTRSTAPKPAPTTKPKPASEFDPNFFKEEP